MHFGHTQARKCEQGAQKAAAQGDKELNNNLRGWSTVTTNIFVNRNNVIYIYEIELTMTVDPAR